MQTRTRIAATISAGIIIAVLAGADSCDHTSSSDPHQSVPGKNQVVFQNPNGFRNVVFSCNGSTGMYVTSAGVSDTLPSGIAVLANDPACK
jgi:hypothetical protein